MAYAVLLTCEHAGNHVPAPYAYLFEDKEEVLYSHKAIDFGALRLAEFLASDLGLPLYTTSTSRLLVEANRSLDNDALFSEYSKKLSKEEKEKVLATYYHPHRNQVEAKIAELVNQGKQVVHLGIHTFTPVMDGEVREADIGILFDPARKLEQTVADQLKMQLQRQNKTRNVLYNSPYAGVDDGFPTYLRTIFGPEEYAGFELEINQKFFLTGTREEWQKLMQELADALSVLNSNS